MSNKGDNKIVMKPTKGSNKGSVSNSKEPTPKRPNNEVSPNTSVDMQHNIESLVEDVKSIRDDLQSILKKDKLEAFIHKTIKGIVSDLQENMELTISLKVEEKTKGLCKSLIVYKKTMMDLEKI